MVIVVPVTMVMMVMVVTIVTMIMVVVTVMVMTMVVTIVMVMIMVVTTLPLVSNVGVTLVVKGATLHVQIPQQDSAADYHSTVDSFHSSPELPVWPRAPSRTAQTQSVRAQQSTRGEQLSHTRAALFQTVSTMRAAAIRSHCSAGFAGRLCSKSAVAYHWTRGGGESVVAESGCGGVESGVVAVAVAVAGLILIGLTVCTGESSCPHDTRVAVELPCSPPWVMQIAQTCVCYKGGK